METAWPALTTTLVAYALGSFPTAYLAGRLARGIDLRRAGVSGIHFPL